MAVHPIEADMSRSEHDRRIDYLELPAIDIPGTKAFYTAVFGWKFTDHGPEYTSFEDGRIGGGFSRDRPVAHGSGPLLVIYATDVEMAQVHVTENGGRVTRGIFSFPGGRRFHFLDPNGNELAVWSE